MNRIMNELRDRIFFTQLIIIFFDEEHDDVG